MQKQNLIRLGDVAYVEVGESTADHDDYMTGACFSAGLIPLPRALPGEDPDEYAHRILGLVSARDQSFPLLGGMLMPAGTKPEEWTRKMATETEAHLRGLRSPEDRAAIRRQIVEMLIPFFEDGIAKLLSSRTSSPARESDPASDLAPAGTAVGEISSVH